MEKLEEQIENHLESIEIPESFSKWVFKQIRKENKENGKESAVKRAVLQKKINENEQMIESLLDNLTKKVIDADTYKANRKRYDEEGIRLLEQMKEYQDGRKDWLDKMEATFDFASNARSKFANGDKQTKREIFTALGSNLLLNNGELTVELKKPFRYIKKGVTQTKALFPTFESLKNIMDKPKKEDLEQLIPIWSRLRDLNPRPHPYHGCALPLS